MRKAKNILWLMLDVATYQRMRKIMDLEILGVVWSLMHFCEYIATYWVTASYLTLCCFH